MKVGVSPSSYPAYASIYCVPGAGGSCPFTRPPQLVEDLFTLGTLSCDLGSSTFGSPPSV